MKRNVSIVIAVLFLAATILYWMSNSESHPEPISGSVISSAQEHRDIPEANMEPPDEEKQSDVVVPDFSKAPNLQDLAGSADFEDIDETTLREALFRIPMENEEILSPGQLDELHTTLSEVMLAYALGDGERLLAELLAVAYGIDEDELKWSRYHPYTLEFWDPPDGLYIPTEPDEILRLSLLDTFAERYTGYYSAIAPASGFLKFYRESKEPVSINDQLTLEMDTEIRDFTDSAFMSVHPKIVYIQSPKALIEEYGSVLYVDLSLPVADAEGAKRMVMKRLYYASDEGRWLAKEIVSTLGRSRSVTLREFF